MLKKIVFSLMITLVVSVPFTSANEVPTVSSFSYSDQLKAGDVYHWQVSSSYVVQDPLFKDNSLISLTILADLQGVEFTGDLTSSELSNYFELDFGESTFVSGEEAIHTVVFPTSITLANDTTINPMEAFWVEVLIDQVDTSDATITASSSQSGDILTVEATVEYELEGANAVSKILARINTVLGITEEYNLDLDLPIIGDQELNVVRVIEEETSTSDDGTLEDDDTDDSGALPINLMWILAPMLLIPVIRKMRN